MLSQYHVSSLQETQKQNKDPGLHDCRRNHQGSSKSMEANVAVKLFKDAVASGVSYSTKVGDDDSTTENHLKTLVSYEIEKWSDVNHSCRAVGSRPVFCENKSKGAYSGSYRIRAKVLHVLYQAE